MAQGMPMTMRLLTILVLVERSSGDLSMSQLWVAEPLNKASYHFVNKPDKKTLHSTIYCKREIDWRKHT